MQVLHRCCCGLDVHKKLIVACLISLNAAGERQKEIRCFTTMTKDILALADWLATAGCTHVALESTGVYWKPIWNLLEGQFEVLPFGAQHIKAVPGRKTDSKDAEWIADRARSRGWCVPVAFRQRPNGTYATARATGVRFWRSERVWSPDCIKC
jgi:transposase